MRTINGKVVSKEHICLFLNQGSKCLGHFTTETISSPSKNSGFIRVLEEKSFSITSFVAIGCYGKNVNTCTRKCVMKRIEDAIGRPVN